MMADSSASIAAMFFSAQTQVVETCFAALMLFTARFLMNSMLSLMVVGRFFLYELGDNRFPGDVVKAII